jgi:hypothetical protein
VVFGVNKESSGRIDSDLLKYQVQRTAVKTSESGCPDLAKSAPSPTHERGVLAVLVKTVRVERRTVGLAKVRR